MTSLRDFPIGELAENLGIELTEVSAERVVGTMPVHGNRQPYGLLNGGAHAALAETLASVAANVGAGPDYHAVGIELNCTHHRGATQGLVTGTATRIHHGRTMVTYEIVMTNEAGQRLCTARLSSYVVKRRAV